jgi:hypothetical protein
VFVDDCVDPCVDKIFSVRVAAVSVEAGRKVVGVDVFCATEVLATISETVEDSEFVVVGYWEEVSK